MGGAKKETRGRPRGSVGRRTINKLTNPRETESQSGAPGTAVLQVPSASASSLGRPATGSQSTAVADNANLTAPTDMTTPCVLKLSLGGDIRRLRTSLPTFEPCTRSSWLRALRDVVSEGLGVCPATAIADEHLVLKYRGNHGDLCNLTVEATNDFVNAALNAACGSGDLLLRLFVEDAAKTASACPPPKASVPTALFQKATQCQSTRSAVPSKSSAVDNRIWTSEDGKACIALVDTHFNGRQPRLTIGKYAFLVHIRFGAERHEVSFDGSPTHATVLETGLSAVRQLAPRLAQTPGWHSVALANGCSMVLRPCLEYQLHLCLKPCASPT